MSNLQETPACQNQVFLKMLLCYIFNYMLNLLIQHCLGMRCRTSHMVVKDKTAPTEAQAVT